MKQLGFYRLAFCHPTNSVEALKEKFSTN